VTASPRTPCAAFKRKAILMLKRAIKKAAASAAAEQAYEKATRAVERPEWANPDYFSLENKRNRRERERRQAKAWYVFKKAEKKAWQAQELANLAIREETNARLARASRLTILPPTPDSVEGQMTTGVKNETR